MVRRRHGRFDVLVIGGGITGLTAAHHAARRGLSTALIEAELFGGQVANVEQLDGYPMAGDPSGVALATKLVEECRALGVVLIEGAVDELSPGDDAHTVRTGNDRHRARAVIVASGGRLKQLHVPGESALLGRGVSQCASCDGPFFRDQDVAVIGGGDAAAQEALVLADLCSTVHVVCRSALRAKPDYVNRLTRLGNVTFVWGSEVAAILGSASVEGVRLRDVDSGATSDLACSAVFPFIGTTPNSEFLPGAVRREDGFVVTDAGFATSVPGIFTAGAVRQGYGGHVAEAVGEAVSAASAALAHLRHG